MVIVAADSW